MNLQQLLSILRGRLWLMLFVVVATLVTTAMITFSSPVTYTSTATLLIDFREPVEETDPLQPLLQPSYLATQVGIITSHNVAARVVDNLKLVNSPEWRAQFELATEGKGSARDWMADALLENLTVTPVEESRLVTISYAAEDPAFAAAVANGFARAYRDTNLELSVDPARKNAEWFDGLLAGLRQKLEQAQAKLSAYQQEKGILNTDEKLDIETARLAEISAQLVAAQAETHNAEIALREMEELSAAGGSLDALPDVLSSTFLQSLKAELGRKEAELAEMSDSYGPKHPTYKQKASEVRSLRAKVGTETRTIAGSLRNRVNQARSREKALKDAEDVQKAKLLGLKRPRDEINPLMREVESAQRNYDSALERLNQYSMQSRLDQTNVTVLNPAVTPLFPSSPNVKLNMALGLMLGLMLGFGLALLLEMTGRKVRSDQDLVDSTGVPLLGMLPRAGG
jgi:chain length determinant protein EpsF